MRLTDLRHRSYYTDVAAALIGFVAGAGTLVIIVGRAAGRRPTYWLLLVLLFLALAAFSLSPRTRHARRTPWIISAAAALVCLSMLAVFWRWPMVWALAATVVCLVVLALALMKRSQALSQPPSRSDLFKVASVAVSLCLAVGVAEAAVRMAPGVFPEEIQQALRADPRNYGVAHPYIGHLHRPDATIVVSGTDFKAVHELDARGFRNEWPWPQQSEVVVLGDSVAFGYGVAEHEAWPAILDRGLPDSRLTNLALIGGGPQQYLRVYETFGAPLAPKLVIVGIWPVNDFGNAKTFDDWLRSGVGGNYMVFRDFGQPRPFAFDDRPLSSSVENLFYWNVYPLLRRSHLFNLIRVVGQSIERTRRAPPRTVDFADGSRVELIPGDLLRRADDSQPDGREFQLLIDSLQRLHSMTAQRGAHTLMVLQPGKEEVYLPLLGETVVDTTADLRDAFDRLGIEYLDLTQAFRERAGAGERLFFQTDSHPNPAGNALIANLLIAHIEANRTRYGL